MTTSLLPDTERLVVAWLLDQDDITTITGTRIWTVLPKRLAFPCLQITRVGGQGPLFDSHPVLAEEARLQIDAYADTKNQAFRLAATVQAIAPGLNGDHELGGIRRASTEGMQYLPDEGLNHKPRYILDLVVTTKLLSPAA